MENKTKLEISQYSMNPGTRYINQGDDSGEDFYHKCLNRKYQEALIKKESLVVDLDGTNGYASSFLDEAFGNLVYDFGLDSVKKNIILISREEPEWIDMINDETFNELLLDTFTYGLGDPRFINLAL
jgi:hypothetical protein